MRISLQAHIAGGNKAPRCLEALVSSRPSDTILRTPRTTVNDLATTKLELIIQVLAHLAFN